MQAYREPDCWDWPLWGWKTREASRESDEPGRGLEARSEAEDFVLVWIGPAPTKASRRTSSNARSNRGSVVPLATAIMVAKNPLISSRPALLFLGMAPVAAEIRCAAG